ncbi:MAG TPA: cupredoxin family copper-binding protein [Acidobacteriaceae bacterium]
MHIGAVKSIRWTASLMLLLASCWCACGAAAGGQKPAATHTILISGFKYQPDAVTVNAGDTIVWKNNDIVPHTVTAADKSFNSGAIRPGATWKFVAKKSGTFPYTCIPHPNMHGTLIVQ